MPLSFSLQTTFDLNSNTVNVLDNTNYIANGVNPSIVVVKGLIILNAPTGVAFVSQTNLASPPINISAGDEQSPSYSLPLVNGAVMNGEYVLNYTANLAYSSTAASILDANDILIPNVDLTSTYEVGDIVVISNSTHAGNNGSKTISSISLSGSDTIIVVSEVLTEDEAFCTINLSKNVSVVLPYEFSTCLLPTASVSTVYDCQTTQFGTISFTDTTDYGLWDVLDKTISAYYPNGLNPAPENNPVVANDVNTLSIPQLATGTWTYNLTSELSQTLSSGLVVVDTLTETAETSVSCKGTLCDLTSCINELYIKHKAALGCGTSSPYTRYVDAIALLYPLAKEAKACGNFDEFTHYYDEMQSTLSASGVDCNCGCCNGDNAPSWVDNSTFNEESILTQIQNEIDVINTTIDGIQDNINTIESDITDINSDISDIYNNITVIEGDIINIQNDITTLQGDVTDLQGVVATIQGDITVIEGDITVIEGDITTIQGDITTIQGDITTIQGDITTIQGDITTIQGDITTIQGDITTIEGDISDIQTQLNNLQAAYEETAISRYFVGSITQAGLAAPSFFIITANNTGVNYNSFTRLDVGTYWIKDTTNPTIGTWMGQRTRYYVDYFDPLAGYYEYIVNAGQLYVWTYDSSGVLSDDILVNPTTIQFTVVIP